MPTLPEIRERHKISQERLARAAGLSNSSVRRLERGNSINMSTLEHIVRGLNNLGVAIDASQLEGIRIATHGLGLKTLVPTG